MDPTTLSQLRSALQAAASREKTAPGASTNLAEGFGAALDSALKTVSESEASARELQQGFVSGDAGVSLESTMIAAQKSQLAFQATLTVRNRMIAAYTDIMNMQV